jgi:hypothetical protein
MPQCGQITPSTLDSLGVTAAARASIVEGPAPSRPGSCATHAASGSPGRSRPRPRRPPRSAPSRSGGFVQWRRGRWQRRHADVASGGRSGRSRPMKGDCAIGAARAVMWLPEAAWSTRTRSLLGRGCACPRGDESLPLSRDKASALRQRPETRGTERPVLSTARSHRPSGPRLRQRHRHQRSFEQWQHVFCVRLEEGLVLVADLLHVEVVDVGVGELL